MKRHVSPPFTFLALLMLAWALASCRPDAAVHDALVRAEALMETNPKAARAVLDSLQIVNR